MTHDRLIFLAELAEEAADYSDNPSWTRQLTDAANTARRMAAPVTAIDPDVDLNAMLAEIHELMGR